MTDIYDIGNDGAGSTTRREFLAGGLLVGGVGLGGFSEPDPAGGSIDGGPVPATTPTGWSGPDKHRFQYDARNSGVAGTAEPVPRPEDGLWSRQLPISGDHDEEEKGLLLTSPAIADNTVYVAANGGIFALSLLDGSVKWGKTWAFTNPPDMALRGVDHTFNQRRPSPTAINGTVYVTNTAGKIYALNAADGTTEWTYDMGAKVVGSPTVVDGTIYQGDVSGQVVALRTSDGSERWSASRPGGVLGAPAVTDGTAYFGFDETDSEDGLLLALSTDSGSQIWQFPDTRTADTVGGVLTSVTADSGRLYTYFRGYGSEGAQSSYMLAGFDTGTGSPVWSLPHRGIRLGSVAADGNTIYAWQANTRDAYPTDNFSAIDATTGTVQWNQTIHFEQVWNAPVVVGDEIYLCGPVSVPTDSGGTTPGPPLHALDTATGSVLWKQNVRKRACYGSIDRQTNQNCGGKVRYPIGPPCPVGDSMFVGGNWGVIGVGSYNLDASVGIDPSAPVTGDTVDLSFSIANDSSIPIPVILSVGLPDGMTVVGHTEDGATYGEDQQVVYDERGYGSGPPTWLWDDIDPGVVVEPTLTVEVSDSIAPGGKELDVEAFVPGTLFTTIPINDRHTPTIQVLDGEFGAAKTTKRTLAERITAAADSIDETATADAALSALTGAKDAGDVSEQTGLEAVKRLKAAERVTERAVVSVGVDDPSSPETLPSGAGWTNHEFAKTLSESVIDTAATLAAVGASISKVMNFLPADLQAPLKSGVDEILGSAIQYLQTLGKQYNNVAQLLGADGAVGEFFTNLKNATNPSWPAGRFIIGNMQEESDELTREVQRSFEGGADGTAIAGSITDVTEQLSGQTGSDPTPTFSGDLDAAVTAADTAAEDITSMITDAESNLEQAKMQSHLTDLIGKLMEVMSKILKRHTRRSLTRLTASPMLGRAVALSAPLRGMSTALEIISTLLEPLRLLTDGFVTMAEVQVRHHEGVNSVVNP